MQVVFQTSKQDSTRTCSRFLGIGFATIAKNVGPDLHVCRLQQGLPTCLLKVFFFARHFARDTYVPSITRWWNTEMVRICSHLANRLFKIGDSDLQKKSGNNAGLFVWMELGAVFSQLWDLWDNQI